MPVNCWKYAREVYLIGRSVKFRSFTEKEREAVIDFIVKMAATRPAYVPYINVKAGNPPAAEYVGEKEERKLVWDKLAKQNDASLAKMIQKIGRSLKIQFCTEEEKALCDALFAATDNRKGQGYNDYVIDEEETSSENEEETSSENGEENVEETTGENSSVEEGEEV